MGPRQYVDSIAPGGKEYVDTIAPNEPTRNDLYKQGLEFAAAVDANEIGDSDWEDVYLADEWADQG